MSVITFMSDFGTEDHYVAAVKAAIIRINAGIQIVDISHHISQADIGHAAYVLKSVYKDFPPNTVHLIAIDPEGKEASRQVAIKWNDQYFVGPDSGIFSLIGDMANAIKVELNSINPIQSTFIAKDVLAPTVANLASGKDIHEMGKPAGELLRLFSRQLKVTKREIAGNVIRVDHYGNLITNIVKSEFDTIVKLNGNANFQVNFGRERSGKIHSSYHEVESGECYVIFNSQNCIQIGINKGNASELLGVHLDAPITINFDI